MVGGVAEALFGIPDEIAERRSTCLPLEMQAVLSDRYRRATTSR